MSKTYLKEGAIYEGDNGRLMCVDCAGMSALYTGKDISGRKVRRMAVEDVAEWQAVLSQPMQCECRYRKTATPVTLAAIAGPDGWPAVIAREPDGFSTTVAA